MTLPVAELMQVLLSKALLSSLDSVSQAVKFVT